MILTITLNPSIDISLQVYHLLPEDKLRCEQYEKEVGGGGINVAKGLARLGLPIHAFFFAAGLNGKWIKEKLSEANLHFTTINSQGETRENISIHDLQTRKQFRLVNKGDGVTLKNQSELLNRIMMIHPLPQFVIVSGSMPPGMSNGFMNKLAQWCKAIQAKLVVDMPSVELVKCFKFTPFLIKPNLGEFLQIVDKSSLNHTELVLAAQKLIAKKCAIYVAISMGKDGGLLINQSESVRLKPPPTKALSTVGAGDSMVAGLTYQLYQNASLRDTLKLGLACGTAATLQQGTKLFDPEIAWKLYKKMK
jgi:6-phosphofructokinase 2